MVSSARGTVGRSDESACQNSTVCSAFDDSDPDNKLKLSARLYAVEPSFIARTRQLSDTAGLPTIVAAVQSPCFCGFLFSPEVACPSPIPNTSSVSETCGYGVAQQFSVCQRKLTDSIGDGLDCAQRPATIKISPSFFSDIGFHTCTRAYGRPCLHTAGLSGRVVRKKETERLRMLSVKNPTLRRPSGIHSIRLGSSMLK